MEKAKKILSEGLAALFLAGAAFTSASCGGHDWSDTVIVNNTEEEVAFKFTGRDEMRLSKGEQAVFTTEAYQRLEYYAPDKRAVYTQTVSDSGFTGEFFPRQRWPLRVINTLPIAVSLSAGGWMEDILTIPAGYNREVENPDPWPGVYLYTPDPVFTVTTATNYGGRAEWSRDDAEAWFTVTIR
ncbi:MAG: hypothetical protein LBD37_00090 [Treponema sp.]|jgi:hypothetical protein|nr:hypothetical protein [Treponema sp.]